MNRVTCRWRVLIMARSRNARMSVHIQNPPVDRTKKSGKLDFFLLEDPLSVANAGRSTPFARPAQAPGVLCAVLAQAGLRAGSRFTTCWSLTACPDWIILPVPKAELLAKTQERMAVHVLLRDQRRGGVYYNSLETAGIKRLSFPFLVERGKTITKGEDNIENGISSIKISKSP